MSTKSEKVWVIILKDNGALYGSTEGSRKACIDDITRLPNDWKEESWDDLYAQGYRCVRATLTYAVPDE